VPLSSGSRNPGSHLDLDDEGTMIPSKHLELLYLLECKMTLI